MRSTLHGLRVTKYVKIVHPWGSRECTGANVQAQLQPLSRRQWCRHLQFTVMKKKLKTCHSSHVSEKHFVCQNCAPLSELHPFCSLSNYCRPLAWVLERTPIQKMNIIFLKSIFCSYNGAPSRSLLLRILKCDCLFSWVPLIFPTSTILMLERSYFCIIFHETGGWRTYDPFRVEIKTSVQHLCHDWRCRFHLPRS